MVVVNMRIVVIMIAVINIIIIIIIITSIIGIFTMAHDCVTAGCHVVLKYQFTRLQVMPAHNISQNRKKPCAQTYRHVEQCSGMRRRHAENSLFIPPPAAMSEPDQAGDVSHPWLLLRDFI